jgi:HK97 family phage major capsid protein
MTNRIQAPSQRTSREETLTFEERERFDGFVAELNEGRFGNYSLRKMLLSAADHNTDAIFEKEVSSAVAKHLRIEPRGFYIPSRMNFGTRALATTPSSAGGAMVFTQPGTFIELLRNFMAVGKLGARIMTGLRGPLSFPRQITGGTLTWTAQNPGSDVADSDMTFDSVTATPKTGQSSTAYSRQLLQESSIDIEALVRSDLLAITAVGIDKAAIQGSGTLDPLGILGTTGIGLVEIGADGGYPTYALLQDVQSKLYQSNVFLTTPGWLTTPGIRGYLKKTPKVASFPDFIWWPEKGDELLAIPAYATNNVPSTLTKGSKSDCHAIIVGNWSDLIICEWGAVDVIVDPYRLKKQGVIEVTSFVMVDTILRTPQSFAVIKDARIVA